MLKASHRDVKLDNILVCYSCSLVPHKYCKYKKADNEWIIKLCDFGLITLGETIDYATAKGTHIYVS